VKRCRGLRRPGRDPPGSGMQASSALATGAIPTSGPGQRKSQRPKLALTVAIGTIRGSQIEPCPCRKCRQVKPRSLMSPAPRIPGLPRVRQPCPASSPHHDAVSTETRPPTSSDRELAMPPEDRATLEVRSPLRSYHHATHPRPRLDPPGRTPLSTRQHASHRSRVPRNAGPPHDRCSSGEKTRATFHGATKLPGVRALH
jgi:hypothetical protein